MVTEQNTVIGDKLKKIRQRKKLITEKLISEIYNKSNCQFLKHGNTDKKTK